MLCLTAKTAIMKTLKHAKLAKMAIKKPAEDNALNVFCLIAKTAKTETLINAKPALKNTEKIKKRALSA